MVNLQRHFQKYYLKRHDSHDFPEEPFIFSPEIRRQINYGPEKYNYPPNYSHVNVLSWNYLLNGPRLNSGDIKRLKQAKFAIQMTFLVNAAINSSLFLF